MLSYTWKRRRLCTPAQRFCLAAAVSVLSRGTWEGEAAAPLCSVPPARGTPGTTTHNMRGRSAGRPSCTGQTKGWHQGTQHSAQGRQINSDEKQEGDLLFFEGDEEMGKKKKKSNFFRLVGWVFLFFPQLQAVAVVAELEEHSLQ